MKEKSYYFEKLYASEMFHYDVLKKLANMENNADLNPVLNRLSSLERKHSLMWEKVVKARRAKPLYHTSKLAISAIAFIRKIFGLEMTIKIMEYGEMSKERELNDNIKDLKLTKRELTAVRKIMDSEKKEEDPLKDKLLKYSDILNNIRNIILGMNDGLVEILGAVAGFAVALRTPSVIIVAGLITAIAGTLSMAGGSYLSIEYEKSLYKTKRSGSSTAAALYTGIAYIIGSMFPLLPFILGLRGYYAIVLSIIMTGIVLAVVSTTISIVSDTSIRKRIFRTLLISLGIVAVTITLGIYARTVLHINI